VQPLPGLVSEAAILAARVGTTSGLTAALMKAMTRTLADGVGPLFTNWPVGPGLL
jgi:hypothetical protein